MFYQIFLSPQVKRWAIITYKHGIYELPHELPNDLRLRINKRLIKLDKNDILVSSLPAQIKALLILAENFWKTEIKLFPMCAISPEN